MNALLSLSDLTTINNEPRVGHHQLALALGTRPQEIARLIRRNLPEVDTLGAVCVAVTQNTLDKNRGRPGREFHLNEAQALLICMFSRTPAAAAVRKNLIEVFMAWRRQRARPAPRRAVESHSVRMDLFLTMNEAIAVAALMSALRT